MNILGFVVVGVFATVVTVTTGLFCQDPHCETVECEPIDPENCNGTVRMGGGYCGCCLACFIYLDYGDICEYKDVIEAYLYPPTVLCKDGLYCERNNLTCASLPEYHFG